MFDYRDIVYVNTSTPVVLWYNGVKFTQRPKHHLAHRKPLCMSEKKKHTREELINKFNKVHNSKYTYGEFVYKNAKEKNIPVYCHNKDKYGNEHGIWYTNATNHLSGYGCPKCKSDKLSSTFSSNKEEFIKKAKLIHGDKYDYSKVNYVNARTKIAIICKEHGLFYQLPILHLKGHGCPLCKVENNKSNEVEKSKLSLLNRTDDFINQANIIHNGKYSYENIEYVNRKNLVNIVCPTHGSFKQLPHNHLQGKCCPLCAKLVSKSEDEIYNFLAERLTVEIIRHDRKILNGKELDFYIPSLNIAIEYNGIRWHSELCGVDKTYHLDKLQKCNDKGINLITIFEDEFINNKDLVLNKILHIVKCNNDFPKIYGRKCHINKIDKNVAETFLNNNHIQGFVSSSIYLGCFFNEKLVGVMSFLKENGNAWNLTRFATDIQYNCSGIGGKLFKYFINSYNPIFIKTFADRRWTLMSDSNLYTLLGFKLDKTLPPDYRYYMPSVSSTNRLHKFKFRKSKLHKKYGLSLSLTESEMTKEIGAYKIWDCGLFRYIWKKED
nr:MAG TPA: endonuclease-like protein [Caudoviricetes sp.]